MAKKNSPKKGLWALLLVLVVLIGGAAVFGSESLQGRFVGSKTSPLGGIGGTGSGTAVGVEFALASSPVSYGVMYGTKNTELLGINFECVHSSKCEIEQITLQGHLDDKGKHKNWATAVSGTSNGTDLAELVSNLRLVNAATGNVVMGPASVDSSFQVTFGDSWALDAGDTLTLTLVGDIADEAQDGDWESLSFSIESRVDVAVKEFGGKKLLSKGAVNKKQRVYVDVMEGLRLSLASSPVSGDVSAGTLDTDFLGIEAECVSSTDCEVTELTIRFDVDDRDYLENIILMGEYGDTLAGPESMNSAYRVEFNEPWTVEAGESMTFYVRADLSSDASSVFLAYLEADHDVEAENDMGSSLLVEGDVNAEAQVVWTVK